MTQYILLIHGKSTSTSTAEEWEHFVTPARQSGLCKGGSEIGTRVLVGDTQSAQSSEHIVGYMRFDSDDKQRILELLERHPVVLHGGSVELCEMTQL